MKQETPKDKAKNRLLDALGKKDLKEIAPALKDFEKVLKTVEKTKEDDELLKVAKAQKEELEKTSSISLFFTLLTMNL